MTTNNNERLMVNAIDYNSIKSYRLPQPKSYLKILGILYFVENTKLPISSNAMKSILKAIHIYNNITFSSYS